MSANNLHKTLTLEETGASDPVELTPGNWALELFATDWNGATVVIEFAGADTEARYAAILDPVTGEAVARTANGPQIVLTTGGGFIRLKTADLSDATGVSLVAKKVS